MQVRLITPVSHRIAEARWCEWLAICGDEEAEMPRPCLRNRACEFWMEGDVNLDGTTVFVLGLGEAYTTVTNMLRA